MNEEVIFQLQITTYPAAFLRPVIQQDLGYYKGSSPENY